MINPFKHINRAAVYSLEKTLNTALLLDPSLKTKLLELDGTILGITFTFGILDRHIYLQFQAGKINVLTEIEKNADIHIQGNPLSMIRLLTAENKQKILFSGDIKIFGDSSVLFRLQHIFKQMNVDWEAVIAQLSGDILGHQLSRLIRKSFRWGKQASDSLVADLDEYLHEEIKAFPTRSEITLYIEEVDELRLAADRLQANIIAFKQKTKPSKQS